jgi:hypothetical protein
MQPCCTGDPGERASLVFEDTLCRGDMTIPLGAKPDFDNGTGGRACGAEHLFAAHHDLDRSPRFLRQHVGKRFEVDDRFATKAAANLGRNGTDIRDISAADARGIAAHHELTLARTVDDCLAVGPDRNQTGVRLDIALVYRLGRVAPFDDHVGFLEAGLDIALGETHDLGDVRRLLGLRLDSRSNDVVVQQRRVLGHRRFDVHYVR